MKINKSIFIITIIVTLVLIFLCIRKCTSDKKLIDVVIPKKEGYFNVPPIYVAKKSVRDSVVYRYKEINNNDTLLKDTIIYTENPVNKQLAKKYANTMDSLEKYKLYLRAIEEKEGTSEFDNGDLNLKIYTKTRGDLLDIKPTYTIKEQKITTSIPKPKEPVFTMYAGAEVIGTKEINKIGYKADIGLQNKKGNMLTLGIDNSKNYYLGVKLKLFSIKK